MIDPSGHRKRIDLTPLPFRIGRQADSNLVIRDSRASRNHAQITVINGDYVIEDANSRHGTFLNGQRIHREVLHDSDRIEFGFPDSYRLIFSLEAGELVRLMDQVTPVEAPAVPGAGANLAKLRAILEVARTLQSSFSVDEVLKTVVDAALAITGAERGFLLLRTNNDLETRVARNREGTTLDAGDLRVPRSVIRRALEKRPDLLSMNFDPLRENGIRPEQSIAELELRSVVCIPLVRIQTGNSGATSVFSTSNETLGVLYMDSRRGRADLAGGNRELLQTLAIEASTVLENARLIEEERIKEKIEEELNVARTIQQSLLPGSLPSEGWFQACGSSLASHQVGGDYFDVFRVAPGCWSAVVTDVSGKGVSSALLAALLQGAFLGLSADPLLLRDRVRRLNHFLNQRTGGDKYATLVCCLVEDTGRLHYVNAGHCPPLLLRADGSWEYLEATGPPIGLIDPADFAIESKTSLQVQKLVIYTDGVTDAQNEDGEYFGRKRLRDSAMADATASCREVHDSIRNALSAFTGNVPQGDDITLLVVECRALEVK